ncbi:MAG: PDZ domain-containing protein [Bacillota bacterium]
MQMRRITRAVAATAVGMALTGVAVPPALAAGGPTVTYRALGLPALRAALEAEALPALAQGMWLFGSGTLGRPDTGFYWGAFGEGGASKAEHGGATVRLMLAHGGIRFGYAWAPAQALSLAAGLDIAVGGATLTVARGEPPSFGDGLRQGYETTFYRLLVGVMPEATAAVRLGPAVHLQAGVGYFVDTGLGSEWRTTNGTVATGSPRDPFSGLQLRIGLMLSGPEEVQRERSEELEERIKQLERQLKQTREDYEELKQEVEEISEAYLGVYLSDVGLLRRWLSGIRGAHVDDVMPGSPAASVGLAKGDIILAFQGISIQGADDLTRWIQSRRPGDTVTLEVWRDGRVRHVVVELGRRPKQ